MDISKEELYKAIGTKIRAMRTAKGWTQEELGNKFDVSVSCAVGTKIAGLSSERNRNNFEHHSGKHKSANFSSAENDIR